MKNKIKKKTLQTLRSHILLANMTGIIKKKKKKLCVHLHKLYEYTKMIFIY